MFTAWNKASLSGEIISLLELMLNQSDILLVHPDNQSRQEAEQFIKLIRTISLSVGGDISLLARRVTSMLQQGVKIESETSPSSNAVKVMTIHSAKGLENKVIVVAGLFDNGQQTMTLSQRGNLLITPELIAGRMRPWPGGTVPEMGIWDLVKTLTKAQIAAEARRLFYVALTRTQNHLILSGAPKGTIIDTNSGVITITRKPTDMPSMGDMWLESLRKTSIKYSYQDSPWIFSDESTTNPVTPITENKEILISPSEIFHQSFMGPNTPSDFRIYHNPSCFGEIGDSKSPFELMKNRIEALHSPSTNISDNTPYIRGLNLELAPNKLDTSSLCKRRYMLENYVGLSSESIKLPKLNDLKIKKNLDILPTSVELGTMYHRLMEIGIGNPHISESPTTHLPFNWLRRQKSITSDLKTINRVLDELLPLGYDSEKTAERLHQLSLLQEQGPLGMLCDGNEINGLKVEGLITEMPFSVSFNQKHDELFYESWTPFGDITSHQNQRSTVRFNGRIDLVLALRDSEGNGYIQAIDFKTEECRYGFNYTSPENGNPLQIIPEKPNDFDNKTQAESKLLYNHRMQLSLYNKALSIWQKSTTNSRKVLPPAILVAASGRLVSWNKEETKQNSTALDELLAWMARVAGGEKPSLHELPRLGEDEKETCQKCPFYIGDIRICAPVGEELGIIKSDESSKSGT